MPMKEDRTDGTDLTHRSSRIAQTQADIQRLEEMVVHLVMVRDGPDVGGRDVALVVEGLDGAEDADVFVLSDTCERLGSEWRISPEGRGGGADEVGKVTRLRWCNGCV